MVALVAGYEPPVARHHPPPGHRRPVLGQDPTHRAGGPGGPGLGSYLAVGEQVTGTRRGDDRQGAVAKVAHPRGGAEVVASCGNEVTWWSAARSTDGGGGSGA